MKLIFFLLVIRVGEKMDLWLVIILFIVVASVERPSAEKSSSLHTVEVMTILKPSNWCDMIAGSISLETFFWTDKNEIRAKFIHHEISIWINTLTISSEIAFDPIKNAKNFLRISMLHTNMSSMVGEGRESMANTIDYCSVCD